MQSTSKCTVTCTIEEGHIVSLDTAERLAKARWWHYPLLVFGNSFNGRFSSEHLAAHAPALARELERKDVVP